MLLYIKRSCNCVKTVSIRDSPLVFFNMRLYIIYKFKKKLCIFTKKYFSIIVSGEVNHSARGLCNTCFTDILHSF